MRKHLMTLGTVAVLLSSPLLAQSGPKMGKYGGIGSSTSTYSGGEPTGGTYSINGVTGGATFNSVTSNTPIPVTSGGTGADTDAGARIALGLGTAATQNTGTSGATIPLLNVLNTWSAKQNVSVTYPGLDNSADMVRVDVGGFPESDEYSGVHPTNSAIVGAIRTPAGTTVGGPMSDVGVSGYAQTSNVARPAMGLYGEGGIMVNGASAWGQNTITVNCQNHNPACIENQGFDFDLLYGTEADIVVYPKEGGTAPAGSAIGFLAVFDGNVQNQGNLAGFYCSKNTKVAAWKICLGTYDGFADVGVNLGAMGTTANQASQPIQLVSRDSGNNRVTRNFRTTSNGEFSFDANANIITPSTNAALGLVSSGGTGQAWYMISNTAGRWQLFNGGRVWIEVGSGSTTINNDLALNSIVKLRAYTVATLPACNSGNQNAMAVASDATAPTYNGALTGGGTVRVPVFCNGTSWAAH